MQNYRRCVVEGMWVCGALELSIRFALNSLLMVFKLIINGHQAFQPPIQKITWLSNKIMNVSSTLRDHEAL